MFAIFGLLAHCVLHMRTCPIGGRRMNEPTFQQPNELLAPKVFIVGMYVDEGTAWYGIPEFNVLDQNITVPGFSPMFPDAHCTSDGSICSLTTNMGAINAASTLTALIHSRLFNLTHTYFLIAGVAGINPKMGTIGGVTFPRFAVHVGLQFEIDPREMPAGFTTGYIPQGAERPGQYPTWIHGTEVFELNDVLRHLAIDMANQAELYDDDAARVYRANYANNSAYSAAVGPPAIYACDTASADQFWSGTLLAEAMENTTVLFTDGKAEYCTTQQEDNGSLMALLRGAAAGLVDFARVIVMRVPCDFDRPFDGQTATENLFSGLTGWTASLMNLKIAGVEVVQGIVSGWDDVFNDGVKPGNYVGDIFGSLGGTPDFGPLARSSSRQET